MRSVPAAVLVALIAAPLLAGCLSGPDDADVLVSIYPVRYVTERLAGDNLTVGQVAPEGHEAHDWEPSARDITRIADARALFIQSRTLETWVPTVEDALGGDMPPVHIVGAAGTDRDDPHTWLDPLLLADQVRQVSAALTDLFPAHETAIDARTDVLAAEAIALHERYTAGLADCRHDVFVTEHRAFSHLAARHGLQNEGVSGLDPEAEPSAARVRQIIDLVETNDLPVIFREPDSHGDIMRQIADETGATLMTLHPIESRTESEQAAGTDLMALLDANLAALRIALECSD